MKQKQLLVTIALTIVIAGRVSAQGAQLLKDDGQSGYTPAATYEDANGQVGIGTVTPSALLEVSQSSVLTSTTTVDYFKVSETTMSGTPPDITTTTAPLFIVAANGNTGIGMGTPSAPLTVRTHEYYSGSGDFGPTIFKLEDPDGNFVGGFTNNGTSSTPGGSFIIRAAGSSDIPSFIVWNTYTQHIPFAVLADGTIANGVDVSGNIDFTPYAQVNIVRNDVHDYLLKMQNNGQTQDYFDVHNNGYVGIGKANSGNAYLEISSGSNTAIPQLFIDNGTVNTSPYFMVRNYSAGIGQDPITNNSTLALKGTGTNGTVLDLYETSNTAWNTQLRFINGTNIRHIIADDPSSGVDALVISPGYAGTNNHRLKVVGDEEVTHEMGIGINPQAGVSLSIKGSDNTYLDLIDPSAADQHDQLSTAINFKFNTGTTEHSIRPDGDGLHIYAGITQSNTDYKKVDVHSNLVVENNVDVVGRIKIGNVSTPCNTNGNCYSLYVEKGILAEHFRCALKSSSYWSDYVFDKKYKLMNLADLEKYISKNQHLPEIPSAKEVAKEGIDLGDMNVKLLAKVEELSLYVIALKKENDAIKNDIKKLKK